MSDDDKIHSMDIGVPIGGAKANYLANHFSMDQREAEMLSASAETLNIKRYRALIESHISDIANHHKQNELRSILKEKYQEELRDIAAENNGVKSEEVTKEMVDKLSRDEVEGAMLSACAVVKGLITLYMDQFCSIEEKYEIGLL